MGGDKELDIVSTTFSASICDCSHKKAALLSQKQMASTILFMTGFRISLLLEDESLSMGSFVFPSLMRPCSHCNRFRGRVFTTDLGCLVVSVGSVNAYDRVVKCRGRREVRQKAGVVVLALSWKRRKREIIMF